LHCCDGSNLINCRKCRKADQAAGEKPNTAATDAAAVADPSYDDEPIKAPTELLVEVIRQFVITSVKNVYYSCVLC